MFAIEVPFCFFQQQKINPKSIKCFLFTTGNTLWKAQIMLSQCTPPRVPSDLQDEEKTTSPAPLPGASPGRRDAGVPQGHP